MHLPIHLDRTRDEPLQNQLFEQLRGLILSGQLKPETRLIATRFLGEQLNISRTTVLLAYERLIAEGYLETRPAIGTFVCHSPPGQPPAPRLATLPARADFSAPSAIDFAFAPDDRLFPYKPWLRITQTILDRQARHPAPLDHAPCGAGVPALRAVIAEWLAFHRGIVAAPEQIVVVSGVQQGLAVAAALARVPERPVLAECPGDRRAIRLFDGMGARRRDCPVDEMGLETARLPRETAALLHVTPSRQRPLGGMLPMDRREALLDWAGRTGALIIEDDSDGDFRYAGSALPPLFSLDRSGSVLYLRGFSETLSAGMSLAYLVLPRMLAETARRIKARLDDGTAWLEQRVLAEFVASGDYDRHLRLTRKILLDRRDTLTGALARHFGERPLWGLSAGTHVVWSAPGTGAADIAAAAAARGVRVYRPLAGWPHPACEGSLLLGYGALEPAQIVRGIAVLADAIGRPCPAREAPSALAGAVG